MFIEKTELSCPHLATKKNNWYFSLFLITHIFLWSIGPYLTRYSLTHDSLEGLTWGLQWQLGYSKHPFLTAWLCAATTKLVGSIDWPIYLLAQLAVAMTFIATWQLAKHILPEKQALLATLLLEAVLFYNINSFNLTPDTLQSPLWALLTLFFYQAVTTQKLYFWLLTGLFSALGVCTKYQTILLLAPMFLFCLCNAKARVSFKKSGIYCAFVIFLCLMTPHILWLYENHLISFYYAIDSVAEYSNKDTLLHHILSPLITLGNEFLAIIGIFILLWPFYFKKRAPFTVTVFHWQFLLSVGLGPLLCSLLLCFINGSYFPPRWSTPYFFAIGIVIVSYLKPNLSAQSMKQFAYTFILFTFILFGIRMIHLVFFLRAESDAFVPNKEMAKVLTKVWHDYSPTPLPFIAGPNYLVSLITPFLIDKPQPYLNWEQKDSPWINEEEIHRRGALFIWDKGQNYSWDEDSKRHAILPQVVKKRFPELVLLPNLVFKRLSDRANIYIGIAIVPPIETSSSSPVLKPKKRLVQKQEYLKASPLDTYLSPF